MRLIYECFHLISAPCTLGEGGLAGSWAGGACVRLGMKRHSENLDLPVSLRGVVPTPPTNPIGCWFRYTLRAPRQEPWPRILLT
ncbi:MAG: hypothetical protein ABR954_04475 [Dehalococcoidales bacterium]